MTQPGSPSKQKKRLAIVSSSAAAVLRFRQGLMREAIGLDHTVMCLSPPIGGDEALAFGEIGALLQSFDAQPPGLPFLARRRVSQSILDQLRDWRPDAVLVCAGVYAFDAAQGARSAGAARTVVLGSGPSTGAARDDAEVEDSNSRAWSLATAVAAHNRATRDHLRKRIALPSNVQIVLVPGEGVDLDANPVLPLPPLGAAIEFLMIAESGQQAALADYVVAANSVAARQRNAKFSLALAPWATIDGMAGLGCVSNLGRIADPHAAMTGCHVVVHLSADDGMPPVVLAALAAGRPVLTLDIPGCRDTVDEGVNGTLVPVRDPAALAAAMENFAARSELILSQARASRFKAERRFDAREAMRTMLGLLDLP